MAGMLIDNRATTADAVANEFLRTRLGRMSPMKLQKLVYYSHGWSLALFDEPLIEDRIEAWQYGPVIPALYYEFKEFGNAPITRLAKELAFEGPSGKAVEVEPEVVDGRSKKLVQKVWDRLGHYSAVELSNLTHSENEPWFKVTKRRPGMAIPNELIRDCFKDMLKAHAK